MATRYQFLRPARPQLLDQLAAAGVADARVEMDGGYPDYATSPGTTCWVSCDPAQYDAAVQVVSLHDAAALDAQDAAAQANDTSDRARVRAAYQNMKSDAAALRNDAATMPATLTAAQVRARLVQVEQALAETNDTLAALARYLQRRGL